jgi:hypothetical protein
LKYLRSYDPDERGNNKRYGLLTPKQFPTLMRDHTPAVLSYVSGDEKYSYACENTFDFILHKTLKRCSNGIVYFHNFGRFDSTFILKSLLYKKSYHMKLIERNNIFYEIAVGEKVRRRYKRNKRYDSLISASELYVRTPSGEFKTANPCIIRDSCLLLLMSLDEISKTFCNRYKKKDFDYKQIARIFRENPQAL